MRLSLVLPAFFGATVAMAEPPRVAVDIAPLHSLVAQVMEGVGTPDLVIRPGASPHHYALRPSEAAALAEADLVVWMGEGLTPWLAGSLDELAGDAHRVTLLDPAHTRLLPLREEVVFEHDEHASHDDHGEHEEDESHDDHADADEHEHHHHGGNDPHAWLDPGNAALWVMVLAGELALLDPENADTYRTNAADAAARLDVLKQELTETVRPVRAVPFMVFHDAYHYFEEAFDIHAAAAIALSDASRPGPARIAALRDLAVERQVACVLTEPQFDPKLARTIVGDDYEIRAVDPMGMDIPPGPALYPALMRALAAGFASCAP